jgi:hypothetical protein
MRVNCPSCSWIGNAEEKSFDRAVLCPQCKSKLWIEKKQLAIYEGLDLKPQKSLEVPAPPASAFRMSDVFEWLKHQPRFPVVLSGIWSCWLLVGVVLFLLGVSNYENTDMGRVLGYGYYYTWNDWVALHISDAVFISTRTAFLAIVASVIAYFWISAKR